MFSSDYPHVEGGRKPVERFEASLGEASEDVRRRFYADNFLFLMGRAARWRLSRHRADAEIVLTTERFHCGGERCAMFTRKKHDETTYEVTKTDDEWRGAVAPGPVHGAATGPHRAALVRRIAARRWRGGLPLGRLWCGAVRHEREVRVRDGLAQLRPGPVRLGRRPSGPTGSWA